MSAPLSSRVVGVDAAVAGFAVVEEAKLARRLGPRTWHVWQVLTTRRARDGATHVTIDGIAGAKGFTPTPVHAVRRSLGLLVACGLVRNDGWRWARVPAGRGKFVKAKVFFRTVYGTRLLATETGKREVSVPRRVKEWLMTENRGGARKGAGRKSQTPMAEVIKLDDYRSSEPQTIKDRAARTGIKDRAARIKDRAARKESNTALAISKTTKHAVTSTLGVRGSSQEKNAPTSGAGSLVSLSDETGEGFKGHVKRAPPAMNALLTGVPPYPGASIVSAAIVPNPPKFTPDHDEGYRVRLLAAFYRGAIERQYGKRVHLLSNLTPRAKSWGILAKAAKLLEDFDVSPAAWCIWAVRRWYLIRTHTNGWKAGMPVPLPPIGVVFSSKMISERCEDEEKRYVVADSALGGRTIFGKTHKLLLVRYAEMRSELMRGGSRRETVAQFFPGSAYEEMVDAAKAEAIETRSRMERDAKMGRMIW